MKQLSLSSFFMCSGFVALVPVMISDDGPLDKPPAATVTLIAVVRHLVRLHHVTSQLSYRHFLHIFFTIKSHVRRLMLKMVGMSNEYLHLKTREVLYFKRGSFSSNKSIMSDNLCS
jgi:hypothetical protein